MLGQEFTSAVFPGLIRAWCFLRMKLVSGVFLCRSEPRSIPHHRVVLRKHVLQHSENRDSNNQIQQPHQERAHRGQALFLHCHHRLSVLDTNFHPQDLIPHGG